MHRIRLVFLSSCCAMVLAHSVTAGQEPVDIDLSGRAPSAFRARGKKLIGFCWGMPSPTQLRDRMGDYEAATPYLDGIVFKLPESPEGNWPPWLPAFDSRPWTGEDVPLAVLSEIRWGQFKHNFISLGPGPSYEEAAASWFDDEAWETVVANIRLLSKAVEASGARGVFLDVENYSGLWHYWHKQSLDATPPSRICLYPGFSYPQVEAKVRERGRVFMEALQTHKPDVVVFATALYSGCGSEPEQNETSLFPLLRAFTTGMLDGAGPDVVFVDGLESTYWANASDAYPWWYETLKTNSRKLAPEKVGASWTRQSTSGMAVFYDALHDGLYTDKLPVTGEYRLQWLEHNLYHGILANDEWTWLYFEKANPWAKPGLPPDAVEAMKRAKQKALNNRALGWTMVWRSLSEPLPSRVFPTPPLRLVSPEAGIRSRAGQPLLVEIETDAGNSLTGVSLLVDGLPAATLTAPPFRARLRGLPPGLHGVVAVGTFAGDADRGQSAPVVFEVVP